MSTFNRTFVSSDPAREAVLHHHADWLDDAVFYEIYPQSFADSNSDGIGDIPGIIDHLDYLSELGATALWINPCFDSPFRDAGYDVRDYTRVAPRYGTNEDLVRLFQQAHARGIHVLLDLVPGHTSYEHPWFKASAREDPAERDGFSDRYIWTDGAFTNSDGMPFISGMTDRDGAFIVNFFASQPALNYGYGTRRQPWQMSPLSTAARSTREAMRQVMRFWLSRGCDGFRVDMADSLVKNDNEDKSLTVETWKRILAPIKKDYPQAAFVSEWSRPRQSLAAGFDMDFYLDWGWVPNGYNILARHTQDQVRGDDDRSWLASRSGEDPTAFLADYLPQYRDTHRLGSFSFITCNHDTPRLAPRLKDRELRLADLLFLTMPGVPFIYYGDEIGMRYRTLPTKEGGYGRTGSRTPMQWTADAPNLGFSSASADQLYLPVDPAPDAPTVSAQEADRNSLLHFVRTLIGLRHANAALHSTAGLSILFARKGSRPLAYLRRDEKSDESIVVAINPGVNRETLTLRLPAAGRKTDRNTQRDIGPGTRTCAPRPLMTLGSASLARSPEGSPSDLVATLHQQSAIIARL